MLMFVVYDEKWYNIVYIKFGGKNMRHVFFSFHYGKDVFRANQVRNSWVTKGSFTEAGFVDSADFEKVKRGGDSSIKKWIDKQLVGTSVTVVLIGEDTLSRKYVKYEIMKSLEKGNGIIGVHIDWLKDKDSKYCDRGLIRVKVGTSSSGRDIFFSSIADTYCYKKDEGYKNLGRWIEKAAKKAGR